MLPGRFTRLGRIFDPTAHGLPPGCVGFAQSPQALVFDGFVRVYFSTRTVDPGNGKYLSQVAFVDLAKDLRTVLRVSERPVLALGGRGCFDEHGIFPFHVLRDGDRILAYTCGWSRRVSVSVETAIGLAVSRDGGLTFERHGEGPVLAASPREPFLVGDPFVRRIGDRLHMWYIFGTTWRRFAEDQAPDRTYKIGHAVSADGISWTRADGQAVIPDRLGADEAQALPTVLEFAGRWHMFFCYRQSSDFRSNPARAYRIGHAWSDDLATWTRDDRLPGLEPAPGDWDAEMMCYPHACAIDGRAYLLYNGNAFGREGFGAARLEP